MGTSAEQEAAVTLAANPITQLDAFSAIPKYQRFLATGDLGPNGLGGIAGFSAVGALLNGNITALDAFSAIPKYQNFLASGDLGPNGLGGIAAFSATRNWINFFTHGDLSRANGLSGIDAFSALPVYNAVLLHGDIRALAASPAPTPTNPTATAGGIDGFSAIPGFLGLNPPQTAPDIPYVASPSVPNTLAKQSSGPVSTLAATTPQANNPVQSFVVNLPKPQAFTPPAPVIKEDLKAEPDPTTPTGGDKKQVATPSYSEKFTPKGIDGSPILFPGGGGANNGMPGWQKALKSIGVGGGDSSAGASPSGTG
jgi:hypothetical protein